MLASSAKMLSEMNITPAKHLNLSAFHDLVNVMLFTCDEGWKGDELSR